MIRVLCILMSGFALLGAGCGATLMVSPVGDPKVYNGIRVRPAVSYIVTKHIETQNCPLRIEESIVHLPVGDPYDVNFAGGAFSSKQFSVSFSDSGVLKQITLNSDPQIDETLTAAATLVEKVGAVAAPLAGPDCGATKSEKIVDHRPL